MNTWLKTGDQVVRMLFGDPQGQVEYLALVIGGTIVLLAMMEWMGKSAGVANRGLIRRLLCAVVGLAVGLAAAAAVVLYLFPEFASETIRLALLIVVPIVAVAVIAVPLQMIILRSSYSGAAVMFISSAVVAAILVTLCAAVLDAVRGGERESKLMKKRSELVDAVIGDK